MVKVSVFNTKGEKVKQISLPEEIFSAKENKKLIAQAVRVFLANQRQGGAKTKKRGEVRGSTKKIWKQKGTGRARHGDIRAPIFVGGGVVHGPTGEENFSLKMPKKMKKKALFAVLTKKLKNKELMIVSGLDKIKPKTKELINVMKNLKLSIGKNIIVLPKIWDNVIKAGRNIANLSLMQARQLNVYKVVKANNLVLTEESIDVLKEVFLNKKKVSRKEK